MSYSYTGYKENQENASKVKAKLFTDTASTSRLSQDKIREISSGAIPMFRFSFLVVDLFFINVINFLLIPLLIAKESPVPYLFLSFVSNVLWIIAAYFTAMYFGSTKFLKRSVESFLLYFTFTLLFIFLNKYQYSRSYVIISFSLFALSLVITRAFAIGSTHYLVGKQHILTKKIILLGYNDLSKKFAANLNLRKELYTFDGYFDDDQHDRLSSRSKIRGTIAESFDYALKNGITEIYSTIPPVSNSLINEIAIQAENNFIRFKFVPDFSIFINRKVHIDFVQDMPVLSLRPEPLQNLDNRMKKRAFDIIFSALVIFLILAWVVPIIALLIKLTSRGPVFFKQLRSGRNNVPFLCFKFRSLHVNGDAHTKQVTRDDARYTFIGKFLRKTNLDELPQFFNVLQGHMSVVGPRPHMLKHTQEFSEATKHYVIRQYVKPGVTGWAQVNGYRGEIKSDEQLQKRIECDINYMEQWSMWLDIRIIILTIYKSFIGDNNAY
jgi:putative colanic acid biosynthesis UDP-glucose lipid carrier transferase